MSNSVGQSEEERIIPDYEGKGKQRINIKRKACYIVFATKFCYTVMLFMCKYNYVTSILLKSTESTCLWPSAMLLLVDHSGGVKLKDLVNELQEVTDWFALGVYLGLEMSTLESVRADSMGIDEGRRSMLGIWMREQEATWSKVVDALVQMKLYYIAVQIASKYSK